MYHPADGSGVENLGEEYIELVNRGTEPVDLDGWQFSDGVDFVFPDVTIRCRVSTWWWPPTRPRSRPSIRELPMRSAGWTGRLSNSGEVIELTDDSGRLIDAVHYADSGDWAVRRPGPYDRGQRGWVWDAPHDGDGRSLELVNVGFSNDYAHNWQASTIDGGTPGAANSVAAADIAPAIADGGPCADHPASRPTKSRSRLGSWMKTPTASPRRLFWRVSTLDPGPFPEVAMLDDGEHGDGLAGDGVFGAVIPAQADGTIVEFYIQAVDGGGLGRTSPGPTDEAGTQDANMLYQVDDADWPIDVPLYRSIMTAQEWDTFRAHGPLQ